VLLRDTSKITELEIHKVVYYVGMDYVTVGLTLVLQALARRPTLTKLSLHGFRLRRDRDNARLLCMALRNTSSLHSLFLASNDLRITELAELAPALYCNTSIKVLNLSENNFAGKTSAAILRDILRSNKTITTLNLSGNRYGENAGAVDCIADGLGSNSTLLEIDLSSCALGDGGVSILAQTLGSRNTTLQKLILGRNSITAMGVAMLIEMMEQNSHHITDLDLRFNETIGNEGASLLTRSLGNNALPNLKRLSLSECGIGNDGYIALVLALKQNTSLLQLDLRINGASERVILALAESLPEIKVLQRVDFTWCLAFVSAMPLLLEGLRKNTSLFSIHVAYCAPSSVPPTNESQMHWRLDAENGTCVPKPLSFRRAERGLSGCYYTLALAATHYVI
jgi:Ran GTPase-activating protein (RanGAP) involved in mRNA processing and transport